MAETKTYAERTVAGWRRAEVKDKVFLQHPLIMPFKCVRFEKIFSTIRYS